MAPGRMEGMRTPQCSCGGRPWTYWITGHFLVLVGVLAAPVDPPDDVLILGVMFIGLILGIVGVVGILRGLWRV